jgi:VanZ family protein
MRTVSLLLCLAYWALLTALLLVPDPAALFGLKSVPTLPWGKIGIHFTAFTILAVLVHATRWPKPPGWLLTAFLVFYGLATETLQAFFPPRTGLQLMDYTENLVGVAAGSGIYWLVGRLVRRRRARPILTPELEVKSAAADATAE